MRADPPRKERFLDLLEAHQGVIRKVAAVYGRDRQDREDLFQEITLELWRAFPSFRGEAAVSTFLYRVALNTALLRLRRGGSRPRPEPGVPLADVAAREAGQPDDEVERLYAAIRELAPLDRALVLMVLEERSHAEIAAVTGLTPSNVGVRLHRCRERLRRRLAAGAREGEARSWKTG